MHTEEEAKELWCPHVRHSDGEETPANCTGSKRVVNKWNTCVGAKCSQWRWSAFEEYLDVDAAMDSSKQLGFCGLAGKP